MEGLTKVLSKANAWLILDINRKYSNSLQYGQLGLKNKSTD
jgi:hypothetical protein